MNSVGLSSLSLRISKIYSIKLQIMKFEVVKSVILQSLKVTVKSVILQSLKETVK